MKNMSYLASLCLMAALVLVPVAKAQNPEPEGEGQGSEIPSIQAVTDRIQALRDASIHIFQMDVDTIAYRGELMQSAAKQMVACNFEDGFFDGWLSAECDDVVGELHAEGSLSYFQLRQVASEQNFERRRALESLLDQAFGEEQVAQMQSDLELIGRLADQLHECNVSEGDQDLDAFFSCTAVIREAKESHLDYFHTMRAIDQVEGVLRLRVRTRPGLRESDRDGQEDGR